MNIPSENHLRDVEDLERKLDIILPEDYRKNLLEYNVFTPDPDTFKLPNSDMRFQIFSFLGITDIINDSIWHTRQMLGDALPDSLMPIASLMDGGFMCIGIRDKERGKIFYFNNTQYIDMLTSEDHRHIILVAEHFNEFLELFDKVGEIDQLDQNGLSLLHKAVGKGDITEIENLLGYGADIDVVSNDGFTPLFIAASEGKTEVVETLLEAGADYEIRCGKSNGTAFYMACAQNHIEIVSIFLNLDPDLANTIVNISPLSIAALSGNSTVMKLLLEYCADPNLKNPDGSTIYDLEDAMRYKEVAEILKLLQKKQE